MINLHCSLLKLISVKHLEPVKFVFYHESFLWTIVYDSFLHQQNDTITDD